MTDAPLDLNAIETSMSNLRVRYHRGQHDGLFEDQEIIASALLVEVRRLRERVEELEGWYVSDEPIEGLLRSLPCCCGRCQAFFPEQHAPWCPFYGTPRTKAP